MVGQCIDYYQISMRQGRVCVLYSSWMDIIKLPQVVYLEFLREFENVHMDWYDF